MKVKTIKLSGTNKDAVIQDVRQFVSGYESGYYCIRVDRNLEVCERIDDAGEKEALDNYERISGYRVDVVPIPDRVVQEANWDEEGNLIQEKKLAGEYRVDISLPDEFELPELQAQVFPGKPDHEIV